MLSHHLVVHVRPVVPVTLRTQRRLRAREGSQHRVQGREVEHILDSPSKVKLFVKAQDLEWHLSSGESIEDASVATAVPVVAHGQFNAPCRVS